MWSASTRRTVTLVDSGLQNPEDVTVDNLGNLYIADTQTHTIKKWTNVTKVLSTVVSSGLNLPVALVFDAVGNLYIGDHGSQSLKMLPADGTALRTAKTGICNMRHICMDTAGDIYIACWGAKAIKKWSVRTGAVVDVVNPTSGYPMGVAADLSGNIYFTSSSSVAKTGDGTLQQWSASSGSVRTLTTGLSTPSGVTFDNFGRIFITNFYGNTVVKFLLVRHMRASVPCLACFGGLKTYLASILLQGGR